MLFDSLRLKVLSFETDFEYLKLITPYCSSDITFVSWDNLSTKIRGRFDLALVDGALPRRRQLELAILTSNIIAIDDYEDEEIKKELSVYLNNFERIDDMSTVLAIFRRKRG
jgi:hypothetical protein